MKRILEKTQHFFQKIKQTKATRFVGIALLLFAIPATVLLAQKTQDIRQRANQNQATITVNAKAAVAGKTVSVSWVLGNHATPTTGTIQLTTIPPTVPRGHNIKIGWTYKDRIPTPLDYIEVFAMSDSGEAIHAANYYLNNCTGTAGAAVPAVNGECSVETTNYGPGSYTVKVFSGETRTMLHTISFAVTDQPVVVAPPPGTITLSNGSSRTVLRGGTISVGWRYGNNTTPNSNDYMEVFTESGEHVESLYLSSCNATPGDNLRTDGVCKIVTTNYSPGRYTVQAVRYAGEFSPPSQVIFDVSKGKETTASSLRLFWAYNCAGMDRLTDGTRFILAWKPSEDTARIQISNEPTFAQGYFNNNVRFEENLAKVSVPQDFPGFSFQADRAYYARLVYNYSLGEFSNPVLISSGECDNSRAFTSPLNKLWVFSIPKAHAQTTFMGGETIQLFDANLFQGQAVAAGKQFYLNCQEKAEGTPPPSAPIKNGSCSYPIPPQTPSGSYFFRMFATDGTLLSESTPFPITAQIATTINQKPVFTEKTIAYCNGTTSRIHLEWAPVPQAAGYNIMRRDLGTNTYSRVGQTSGYGFNDETVTAGKQYNYYVEAIFSDDSTLKAEDKDMEALTCTISEKPDFTNTVSWCYNTTTSRIGLTWKQVPGASYYNVMRRNLGTSTYKIVGSTSGLALNDDTVAAGEQYNYYVQAVLPNEAVINGTDKDVDPVSCTQ